MTSRSFFRTMVLGLAMLLALPARADIQRVPGNGMLGTLHELGVIAALGRSGAEPHRSNINSLRAEAQKPWRWGDVAGRYVSRSFGSSTYSVYCTRERLGTRENLLADAGSDLYARSLAWVLTGDTSFGWEARRRLLQFASSWGYGTGDWRSTYSGANQCALELAWFVPLMVESAILIEYFPGWTASDRQQVREWMANVAYPIVSAIAAKRKNNWGAAAAFAAWSAAYYVSDSGVKLKQRYPSPREYWPNHAMEIQLGNQLRIMGSDWRGDSRCDRYGIQWHGGIPDELRRGSAGCDARYLPNDDRSYDYQIKQVGHLVFHAEAMRRYGNNELFNARLNSGEPMLKKAILFVIDNPNGRSWDWEKGDLGALRLANGVYNDWRFCQQLAKGKQLRQGQHLPFTRVTYPAICN